jgi:four helix bundle protein
MAKKQKIENENLVRDKSLTFALLIIYYYKFLISKNEFVLSKQLLKSRTNIGANIEEVRAVQSQENFLSKMYIASKEARETLYWLKLLNTSNYLDDYPNADKLFEEICSIINIITRMVKTVGSAIKK